jgi:hypothetical protein
LQTVFNATYVHNNLAVRFAAIPQWLTVAPDLGRVLAGNSDNVTVSYGATGLGRHLNGIIHRLECSDDADQRQRRCVIGAPNIGRRRDGSGLVYVGFRRTARSSSRTRHRQPIGQQHRQQQYGGERPEQLRADAGGIAERR